MKGAICNAGSFHILPLNFSRVILYSLSESSSLTLEDLIQRIAPLLNKALTGDQGAPNKAFSNGLMPGGKGDRT